MNLQIGQTTIVKRIFTQDDFNRFAALSGDDNPIHVDPIFASSTRFGRTVCHGMLLYAAICQVLGSEIPGPGVVQMNQEMMFPSPTYAGEEITINITVLEPGPNNRTVWLETTIVKPDGSLALEGRSLVGSSIDSLKFNHTLEHSHDFSEVRELKGLRIGQRSETARIFSGSDISEYADLTGDRNPLIVDKAYAQQIGLPNSIIPGGLIGGLFSFLLGTKMPGQGTNWLKQKIVFHRPAFPNQEIRAQVEVIRLRPDKDLVNLQTTCVDHAGELICSGEALVYVKDLQLTV